MTLPRTHHHVPPYWPDLNTEQSLLFVSDAFVTRVASIFEIDLSQYDHDDLTRLALTIFPLPMHLYRRLIRRVVEKGHNMSKKERANSIWDLHIGFSVGTKADTDGAARVLVTNDQDILAASEEAGVQSHVMSLEDYGELLQLDWESFRKCDLW